MAEWAAALAPSGVPYRGFKKEAIVCITVMLAVLSVIQHIYDVLMNFFSILRNGCSSIAIPRSYQCAYILITILRKCYDVNYSLSA